jgi:VWFA-related protein
VTDGADNRSRRNFSYIRNALAESRVQLYAMGITTPVYDEEDSLDRLEQLANLSGGRHFPVQPENLAAVSTQIGHLLRERYVLGFVPENLAKDGKYRRLSVTVTGDAGNPFQVQHRPGYYASNF